jgi:hypothetical protein
VVGLPTAPRAVSVQRAKTRLRYPHDPPSLVTARRLILVVAVPFFLVDGFAIYRRLTQLRRLDVLVTSTELRAGSAVIVEASSWATTVMTVRLELVQGARSDTLLVHRLLPNEEATLDPRPRNASLRVVLTAERLSRYGAGEAVLRATATWRAQLLRTSRPVVRELAVRITPAREPPRRTFTSLDVRRRASIRRPRAARRAPPDSRPAAARGAGPVGRCRTSTARRSDAATPGCPPR